MLNKLIRLFPESFKKYLKKGLKDSEYKKLLNILFSIDRTLSFLTPKGRWISKRYSSFGKKQREYIFLSMARFLVINRPINGYYFEFGCNEANTIKQAFENFRYLFDFTYVGFDSFEGLPEISEIDKQDIWEKGKLAYPENKFIKEALKAGIPKNKLITVKGFYDKSLTMKLKEELLPNKAAVIYVDCDLYKSTVPVLDWIKDFLQIGTIIVFDDWYCFNGDPMRGERRAWEEFKSKNTKLRFTEFVKTNEACSFIYLGEN